MENYPSIRRTHFIISLSIPWLIGTYEPISPRDEGKEYKQTISFRPLLRLDMKQLDASLKLKEASIFF